MKVNQAIPLIGRDALASCVRQDVGPHETTPASGDRSASVDGSRGGRYSLGLRQPVLGSGRDLAGRPRSGTA